MPTDTIWLTLPDIAERLNVPVTRVREYVRDRDLVAVRRGENNALHVPASFLLDGDEGATLIPTLRGTVFVLADAGFTDDEVVEWLLAPNDELKETPIDALRSGKRAPVRRAALAAF